MPSELCERHVTGRKKTIDTSATRDRIDLRAEKEWVARVERQAKRYGMPVSVYIRRAVTKELEQDEANEPDQG